MDLDTALTANIYSWTDAQLDAAWKVIGVAKLGIRQKYNMVATMGRQAINGKVPHDAMTRQHEKLNNEVKPYLDRMRLIMDEIMLRQQDAAQARSRPAVRRNYR